MKRFFAILLTLLMSFSSVLTTEAAAADINLFSVELTIPADFLDSGTTQESLDAQAEENGWKSATLNADGSATYIMSKAQHKELMADLKQQIEEGLPDIISTGDFPNFVSVSANDNFTEFVITTKTDSLNFAESFSVLAFYMVGGMYNSFNGTPENNINVKYINEASGETIEEYNSINADTATVEASVASDTISADTEANHNDYSLPETIIVDNDSCAFIVTEVVPDGTWGFTVKVRLENRTDKNLMFSLENVSIVGYMIDPFWAEEVAPGKKAISEISFSNTELKNCGITSVDEIMFDLRVYDYEDWSADDIVEDTFAIYPTGLNAETVVYPERLSVDGEIIILDNEICIFIVQGVNPEDLWGYALNCYIENKSDHDMMFSWDDVSVNGFMCDPYWAKTVAGEKRVYTDISFFSSDLELCGIDTVTDIEFVLRVTDEKTYNTVFEEMFTYTP